MKIASKVVMANPFCWGEGLGGGPLDLVEDRQPVLRETPTARPSHTLDEPSLAALLADAVLPTISERERALAPYAVEQVEMFIGQVHLSLLK